MAHHIDVFVSSTSKDLTAHRAAVKEAILDLGLHPIMMENFPAEGATAVQRCKRAIRESEVYVGIYAHRYGWTPKPEDGGDGTASITALEYQWAREKGIPILCFLVDPAHPWTPKHIDAGDDKTALDTFKARVENETIRRTFTTPENLAVQVATSLMHAVKDLTGTAPTPGGWRPPAPALLSHNFVGRAADVTTLSDHLTAANGAPCVVRGIGGVGKTFLARHLARSLADHFPGGVLWAGLGPSARVPETVLSLTLPDWVSANPAGRTIDAARLSPDAARALLAESPGRLLAVLDDVWHADAARALITALPPGTACLITTRDRRIAALGGRHHTLHKLSEPDGLALLVDRLRVSGADPDPHLDHLRAIVHKLDGHALALDLAARQLIERGTDFAARFVERLDRHLGGQTPFKLLALGADEQRDDSLEAALYLSYEPLSADLQAKFRALGALAPDASFGERTAFAAWDVDTDDQDTLENAEDALAELVRVGLVGRPEVLAGRCEQHPLLHAYARALAQRANERDPALGRYSRHVIDELAEQFFDLPLEQWNTTIGPDYPHIHHIGDRLADYVQAIVLGDTPLDSLAGPEPPTDLPEIDRDDRMVRALVERGSDFAVAVYNYIFHRRVAEGRRWLYVGLACARLQGNRDRERLLTSVLASWHDQRGFKQAALDYNMASLVLCRELGDKRNEATTLNNIGSVYDNLGDRQRALDFYQQVLLIDRESGDRAGEATTLNNIGGVYRALGDRQRALDFYQQALPIFREVGDRAGEATTLNNIGGVYHDLGDRQRALEYYQQALPILREIGDRAHEAGALNNIGLVYHAQGDNQRALDFYQQALPIRREVGDRAGEAVTCFNIGLVLHNAFGRTDEAIRYLERSVELFEAVGSPHLDMARATLERLRGLAGG